MPTTSASTTEMKIWQVYLWCTLVGHCVSVHNINWTPISVDRSLSVARGGQVDVSAAITYHRDAVTTDCNVQFLPTGSCGQVRPSRFSCSDYFGPILYQHIGCPAEIELATFLASSPTDTSANVSIFSVEILIGPAHTLAADITLELLEGHEFDTTLEDQGDYNYYRIVFPPKLIGRCHYEVVTDWQRMLLPSSGVVMGASNQPLPCGFSDSSGLIYIPSNSSSPLEDDHLLIKLHSYDRHMEDCFVFLAMNLGTVDGNNTSGGMQELPTQFLVVRQGANTPIPPSLLTFHNYLHSFQLNDSQLLYFYTFPVLEAGSFRSSLSSSVNVTHTVFTSRELLKGNVAFYPNFSVAVQTVFRYSISNSVGVVVAIGEVNVTMQKHNWNWPVQRTNAPLEVMKGGSSIFDQRTLDFYLQTDLCTHHAAMSLLVSPVHGHLTFLNGSDVGGTGLLISALRNGTVMTYTHSSGSEELTDSIVWEVSCPNTPVLQVYTSILIAPSSDSPTVLLRGWDIKVHHGWATLLSPSIIDTYDQDSTEDEISVTMDELDGSLLKFDRKKLNCDHFHCFLPFIEAKKLLSQNTAQDVSNISLSDLESYKIWYVPPANSSTDQLQLKFLVGEYAANIGVDITNSDLNQTLYLTTQYEYPSVARNLPLPLYTLTSTYITSFYLYSQALPHPPDRVVYVVHSPPRNGLLCLLSGEKCQTSTNRFTQRDINSQRVFYKPGGTGNVDKDSFVFELTMDDFHQHTAILYHFHFKPAPTVVEVSMDRTFFVNAGESKAIALRHFRPFSRFLSSRDIVFHVKRHPHYGHLELDGEPNPSNFSFSDLKQRDLVYYHNWSARNSCSDQFSFTVGNSTHSLDGTMRVAIRRGRENVNVSVNVGHHTLYSGQRKFVFGSDDINVSSSFCLDFVTFTLRTLPSLGVLSLVDIEHNTVVQLEQNSTFSASDIYSGFVHYTFTNKGPMRSQVSDMFILSANDPTSSWPPPMQRQNTDETDETNGHFRVTIIPSQDIEHELIINITSPGFLTWLPDYQHYGFVFSENDILIYNSTIEPHQVVIQLDREPEFGSIWKQNSMDNIFTVEDVNNGLIWYRSDVRLKGFSSDSFLMSIVVTLMDFSMLVNRKEFIINWATVQLQNSSLVVSENEGQVEVVVRRTGSLWLESQVLVTTIPESAITNTGCRPPADFCNMSQMMFFPINVTEKSIIIEIDDDDIAEDAETFSVVLGDPSNVVIDESRNHTKIWISDIEDYSVVTMMGGLSSNPECSFVTRVEEGDGRARIKLQRTKNLQQRVGVVCYTGTQSNFARANESTDYVPRPRNDSSIVWFEANLEFAYCDIDIIDDDRAEFIERFFVKLDEKTEGRAVLSDPNEVHCVVINNDRNDLPRINFTTPELVVRENNRTDKLVPITLLRTGPDLSQETEVKCQWWLQQGRDHAAAGLDFALPQNESCPDDSTSSCITFRPGERRVELHVVIKHDNVLEPNESFHLILETAYKVYPDVMNVIIMEGFSPSVIRFAEPVYVVNETSGYTNNAISIVRSGYLNSSVDVFCRLKGVPDFGNATARDRPGPGADFITAPAPSGITLRPGDTTNKGCPLYVADDSVWEGPESLTVELELSRNSLGAELVEEMSRAQVIIDDSEDIPTMQFHGSLQVVAMEPLSNFDIDKTKVNLTLVRTGDQTYTTSVMYKVSECDSPATLTEGEVVFYRNEIEKQIKIELRANHERNEEPHLKVQLFNSRVLGDVNVPVKIAPHSHTVNIEIQNTEYVGPFFPDMPIVANEGEVMTAERDTNTLYYDHPLLCITPCSSQYSGNTEELRRACASENISQVNTIYSWEISQDGTNFTALVHTTSLTNTHSEQLDTFYLMPNVHVRCKAQAVSLQGVKGHARMSRSVTLDGEKYSCNGRGKAEMELTSYSSFSGHNKAVCSCATPYKHHPSFEFTSHTNVSNMDAYECSTLTLGKRFSWLNEEPLYSHLDRGGCVWEFSRWLPVDDWLRQCGGRLSYSSGTDFINISVYTAYHQYWSSVTVEQEPITGRLNYSTSESTPFLPPPFHSLSASENSDVYIYPIAIQEVESPTGLLVYFYSILPLGSRQTYATSYSMNTVLLHTENTTNTSKQAWRLEVDRALSKAIPVEFQLPCGADCGAANRTLTFSLALARDHEEYTPALRTTITLQHNPEAANNHTEQFTLGDQVYIVFDLDPAMELQDGFVFNVSEVNLCRRTEVRNSTNQQMIATGIAPDTSTFDVRQEHTAVLHFSTSSIKVEQSPSLWCLDITYGISKDHKIVLTENAILNITFVDPTLHTTFSTQIEIAPSSQAFLYAAVGVLVIALLILVVSCTAIGIAVWTSRMKAQIKRKVQSHLEAQRQSESRKNSVALNNRKKERVPSESEQQTLRRSQSTIGFPTREKLKRVRAKRCTSTISRVDRKSNERTSLPAAGASTKQVTIDEGASVQPSVPISPRVCFTVKRARSLPNLTILESRTSEGFFMGEPQPRKLHFQTTVSRVNTERWHLNKWAQHHIKANKQLETARTIHDLATRRRNYGANESKQNTSLNKENHNELARYAVRSLAASAKTPEPEKGPRTKL